MILINWGRPEDKPEPYNVQIHDGSPFMNYTDINVVGLALKVYIKLRATANDSSIARTNLPASIDDRSQRWVLAIITRHTLQHHHIDIIIFSAIIIFPNSH
jgi:hypothetical protein